MDGIIINIKELVNIVDDCSLLKTGLEMQSLKTMKDSYLIFHDGKIIEFGLMTDLKHEMSGFQQVIDASGKMVFPAFVDSHTHLVYAGSREIEYIDKIKGLSYEEIAKRGGGILNSAKRLHQATEDELFEQSLPRINDIIRMGTGAVEIKSGYGLNTADELKMLRVIKRLKQITEVTIKSTFLGAHSFPAEYKENRDAYVDLVVNEMIPAVAEENLADFVDVFCDKGFFSVEQTARILETAGKFGLIPKIHANELDFSGGIQVGVEYGALSVDHLEFTGDAEIEALRSSSTMPTILPGAAFFLNMQLAPARKMIESGLPIALASDFNPGSSPSGNMQLIAAMGSIMFRLLPEEVIHATTLNTAYAMGLSNTLGSISIGKIANLIITRPMPSYQYWVYSYGDNKVDSMVLNGKLIF